MAFTGKNKVDIHFSKVFKVVCSIQQQCLVFHGLKEFHGLKDSERKLPSSIGQHTAADSLANQDNCCTVFFQQILNPENRMPSLCEKLFLTCNCVSRDTAVPAAFAHKFATERSRVK